MSTYRYNVSRDGRLCCRSDEIKYLCDRCRATVQQQQQSRAATGDGPSGVPPPQPMFPTRAASAAVPLRVNRYGVPDAPALTVASVRSTSGATPAPTRTGRHGVPEPPDLITALRNASRLAGGGR